MRTSFLSVVLVAMGATASAQITHFWVDAVNGSDTNPGTQAQPFKSLTMGINAYPIDVVVHVMPGTYGPQTTGDFWDAVTNAPASIFMRDVVNFKLIGEDMGTCILDFTDPTGAPIGSIFWGMIQIRGAITNGVEVANLSFKNLANGTWGCGPITTDGSVTDIDIHNCFFQDTNSTFICWGGFDVAFHDNVIVSSTQGSGVAIRVRTQYGGGQGDNTSIYNNVIYNTGHGISYDNTAAQQWICNNIVLNADQGFPGSAPSGANVVIENNIAFSCTTANFSYTPSPSNQEVDPLLVNPAGMDFHQTSGSPCLDGGYPIGLPKMRNDFYGNARVVDGDNNVSAIADIGVHEVEDVTLAVNNWGQGQNTTFATQQQSANSFVGILFITGGPGSLVISPIGSLGVNMSLLITTTAIPVPGTVTFPVPSSPLFTGWPINVQCVAGLPVSGGFVFKPTGTLDLYL